MKYLALSKITVQQLKVCKASLQKCVLIHEKERSHLSRRALEAGAANREGDEILGLYKACGCLCNWGVTLPPHLCPVPGGGKVSSQNNNYLKAGGDVQCKSNDGFQKSFLPYFFEFNVYRRKTISAHFGCLLTVICCCIVSIYCIYHTSTAAPSRFE